MSGIGSANSGGMPNVGQPFTGLGGIITRPWFLFLQSLLGAAANLSVAPLSISKTISLPPGGGTILISESGSIGSGALEYLYYNKAGLVVLALIKTVYAIGSTNITSVNAVPNGFTISSGNTAGNANYIVKVVPGT